MGATGGDSCLDQAREPSDPRLPGCAKRACPGMRMVPQNVMVMLAYEPHEYYRI